MKTKADSLTRLVERTMGKTKVVQPMIPPMFSFVGPGEAHFAQPGVLNDNNESPLPVKENENLSLHREQPPQPLLMQQEPVEPVFTSKPADRINAPQTASVLVPEPKKPGLHEEITLAQHEDPGKVTLTKPREKGPREPVYPTALPLETKESPEPVDSPLIDKNRGELLIKENNFSKGLLISKPGERISHGPVPFPEDLMDSDQYPGDKNERLFVPLNGSKMVQPEIPVKKVSSMSPKESEAPAVHVTIGRVEVRAVMEQPVLPSQPPPPPTPVLTLEEYLQMRDGGER